MTVLLAVWALASPVAGWFETFDEALSDAKSRHAIVMADVVTDWCGFCKKMDATTFQDRRVIAKLAAFSPVKLDAEKAGAPWAKQWSVDAYPTIVFFDDTYGVVGRLKGYQSSEELLVWLDKVTRARDGYAALRAEFESNPNSLPLNLKMCETFAVWARPADVERHLKTAVEHGAKGEPYSQTCNAVGDMYETLGQYAQALSAYETAAGSAFHRDTKAHAMQSALYAADKMGDKVVALKWAKALVEWKDCPKEVRYSSEAAVRRLGG